MSTVAAAVRKGTHTVSVVLDAALARHRTTFAILAGAQLVATVGLALAATHNGWVWFQGGDQTWFTSDAWSLGRGILPPADVSPGWSLPLIPVTWATGPTFVDAMPLVVALDLLLLAPLALWCVRDIATRLGGQALGLWASLCWIAAPFAAIPLFVDRYQERWIDEFLPQALGLTAMADYPSMVACLVVACLVVRSLDSRTWTEAALAGIVLGFAGFMKPPNFLLGVGIALAYLVARRWRDAAVLIACVVPALVALTVYKERGLGYIPAFSLEEVRVAAGGVASTVVGARLDLGKYLEISVDHWQTQMAQLREFLWSARLAQWVPLAGVVAVARLRLPVAALLAGWLGAFLVVKGMSPRASIEANTFWRLLMPAWPAYLLLLAAVPALAPTLTRRLGERVSPPAVTAVDRRLLWGSVAALAVLPLALVSLARPTSGPDDLLLRPEREIILLTPVVEELRATTTSEPGGAIRLTWPKRDWGAEVSYRIYKAFVPVTEVKCVPSGVTRCTLEADEAATTTGTTWLDPKPDENGVYRVGVAVRYDGGVEGADVFALSPTAFVRDP